MTTDLGGLTTRTIALLASGWIAAACACDGGGSADDSGPDADGGTDTDTDSDTDSDTNSDSDTDTEWEFGDPVPCESEPLPGELCVPGGNYLMGCVPGDTECEENELPLVMVTHSPFLMDEKEATIEDVIPWLNAIKDDPDVIQWPTGLTMMIGTEEVRLWGQLWAWGLVDDGEYVSPVIQNGDGDYVFDESAEVDCPSQGGVQTAAGGFSWLGAKIFCEHKGMRLPTEAQWEAAARGQTFNEFPCGSDLPECWYGVYDCCTEGSDCYATYGELCHCCAPFESSVTDSCISPLGFLNMYGNASEWTADYISVDHSDCIGGCVDPQPAEEPPYEGAGHVYKGGDMRGPSQSWLRISIRWDSGESLGNEWTGVRCVRPDEPVSPPDAGTDSGAADGGL